VRREARLSPPAPQRLDGGPERRRVGHRARPRNAGSRSARRRATNAVDDRLRPALAQAHEGSPARVGITHGRFSRLSSRWNCFSIRTKSWFRVSSLSGNGRTGGVYSRSSLWFALYHHAGKAAIRAPQNPPLRLQVLCVERSAVKGPPSGERSPGRGRSSGCSRTRGHHDAFSVDVFREKQHPAHLDDLVVRES
jgi:hypothetical protein